VDPKKVILANQLYRLSAIGMNLAACVFVGLALGWLCRRYLHWGDWVVIAGILVGVVAGFTETIYEILRMTKTQKDKKHDGT
jgi:ATP synthase protein I